MNVFRFGCHHGAFRFGRGSCTFHVTVFSLLFSKVSNLLCADLAYGLSLGVRFSMFLPSVVQSAAHSSCVTVMLQVADGYVFKIEGTLDTFSKLVHEYVFKIEGPQN